MDPLVPYPNYPKPEIPEPNRTELIPEMPRPNLIHACGQPINTVVEWVVDFIKPL